MCEKCVKNHIARTHDKPLTIHVIFKHFSQQFQSNFIRLDSRHYQTVITFENAMKIQAFFTHFSHDFQVNIMARYMVYPLKIHSIFKATFTPFSKDS